MKVANLLILYGRVGDKTRVSRVCGAVFKVGLWVCICVSLSVYLLAFFSFSNYRA